MCKLNAIKKDRLVFPGQDDQIIPSSIYLMNADAASLVGAVHIKKISIAIATLLSADMSI